MSKENEILGCLISLQWDKKNEEDWIILKDSVGKVILKVQKKLWDDENVGFTPEIRDSIIKHAQMLYG